jgi:hypothetical protein
MSKIRTVKPELFRHEQLFEAEQQSGFPLRLIFIGIFTVVDAEGRFRWRPRQLKLDILPYDEMNFNEALNALADFGFVQRYEYEGEYYGYIPTWHKHQSINQREPESVLPDPQRGLIINQPPVRKPMDTFQMQDLERTVQAQVMHRPALDAANRDSTIASTQNQINKTPSVPIFNPNTTIPTSSAIAEPRTCMHIQDSAAQMHNPEPPMLSEVGNMPASLEMEMEVEVERELEMELEMEGKGKWKNSKHPHIRAVPDPVMSVFEHWRCVMDHPKAVLDKQRRRYIRLALDGGYSVEDLCLAITGCSLTPHNCGQNDRGERYDGLHLILRSADQIDRFIRNAQHPPRPLNVAEQRLQGNVQAAQDWLQQQEAPGESR